MSNPDAAIVAVCVKLQFILKTVWIVKIAALIFVVAYFLYLFLLPGEPRVRRSTWAGKWYSQVWVQNTKEEPEWWTTSISEYAAARGSTGSKLLGSAMSVCGALQVVEGSLLGALCVASDVAKVFLWVGGIGAIVLGQMEASDEFNDPPDMVKLKKSYAVWHAVGALAFVALTTAGVIITRTAFNWISGGLAIGGCFAFGVAVLFQQLTGNYGGTPKTCCLPQRPEDRNPENKPFGLCHGWLNHQAVRIWLSRFVLTAELMGVSLVIFSVTFLSIYQSTSGRFCDDPTQFFQKCFLPG